MVVGMEAEVMVAEEMVEAMVARFYPQWGLVWLRWGGLVLQLVPRWEWTMALMLAL